MGNIPWFNEKERKSMKKEFEMTEQDLNEILESCKPVPYLLPNCGRIRTPQENANSAWENLGNKMGFDFMTVEPTSKGDRFFLAEPKI